MSSERPEEQEATVLVRGETVRDPQPKSSTKDKDSARKEVSEAKVAMQTRLPVLDDDTAVGIQKEEIVVVRDGKADLAFSGTLLASAAPPSAVAFFGYDPLAKTLYRKLSGQFEEHIS